MIITKEEQDFLNKFDEDMKKDTLIHGSYEGDMYGCWPSCRSREDWFRAANIRMRIIDENLKELYDTQK